MAFEHLCLGCMSYLENPYLPCPNCGWLKTMQNAASQLQTGYTLTNENQTEKYIIGRALGQGGFGISYLAWNANSGEKVVIKEYFPSSIVNRTRDAKVIPLEKDTAQFRHGLDNFLKEAYKMLEFSADPNVVSVKNFFQANDTAYIVMEFIDGQTLTKIIEQNGGRININVVLKMLAPIAEVLERMHKPKINSAGQILRQPLLHRDVSPDNIMFTRSGVVKLLDFGAARPLNDDKSGIIRTGYSPPEQFVISDSNFVQGAWTDVYGLAATIYHAVTGQVPPHSVSRLGNDSLALPSSFGVQIESFQERVLLKGLSPDYRKRYQTVSEFMNSLRADNSPRFDDKKILVTSIALTAVGAIVATYLFIFALNMIFSESIFEMNFIISLLASMTSMICLDAFSWDFLRIYKGLRPKYLNDISRQDVAFLAHVVCTAMFLFFGFFYADPLGDNFISEVQMEVFLETDLSSDGAELLVNSVILLYAVISVAGIFLGRKFLTR